MTIQATRFKVLDKQTKIGVSDFLAIKDSGILNSPDADFKTIDQITQELIANTVQQVEITPPSIVDTAIRSAKDGLSAIVDIGKYSSKDLDKMIGSLVGGNSLTQNLFGKLSPAEELAKSKTPSKLEVAPRCDKRAPEALDSMLFSTPAASEVKVPQKLASYPSLLSPMIFCKAAFRSVPVALNKPLVALPKTSLISEVLHADPLPSLVLPPQSTLFLKGLPNLPELREFLLQPGLNLPNKF